MSMTTHGSVLAKWVALVAVVVIAIGVWAGYRHLFQSPAAKPPQTDQLSQRVLAAEQQAIDDLARYIHSLYQRKWYRNWPERLYGPPREQKAIRQSLRLVKPDAYSEWYASLRHLDTQKLIGARSDLLALFRYSINSKPADDRLIIAMYVDRAHIWATVQVLSANALNYPDYEQAMASGKVTKYTVGSSR